MNMKEKMVFRYALEFELRKVLNSPNYKTLSNQEKADILLELENDGEYDPSY